MLGSKRREQRRNELESAETARRLALMVGHSTVMGRRAHSFRGRPRVSFLEILSLFREKVGWDGAGAWSHPALQPLRPWAFYKLVHLLVFNSCFISRSKWKILIGKVCMWLCFGGTSGSEKGCFVPFNPFKSSLAIRLDFIYPRQWKARLTKGDKEFGSFSVILFNKIRCL